MWSLINGNGDHIKVWFLLILTLSIVFEMDNLIWSCDFEKMSSEFLFAKFFRQQSSRSGFDYIQTFHEVIGNEFISSLQCQNNVSKFSFYNWETQSRSARTFFRRDFGLEMIRKAFNLSITV